MIVSLTSSDYIENLKPFDRKLFTLFIFSWGALFTGQLVYTYMLIIFDNVYNFGFAGVELKSKVFNIKLFFKSS